jgi:hypothetical protein
MISLVEKPMRVTRMLLRITDMAGKLMLRGSWEQADRDRVAQAYTLLVEVMEHDPKNLR